MKPVTPITNKELLEKLNLQEVIYAKDQPEYLPLPVVKSADGVVTSKWKLSLLERINILLTGILFIEVMTFNKPLQPIKPTTGKVQFI